MFVTAFSSLFKTWDDEALINFAKKSSNTERELEIKNEGFLVKKEDHGLIDVKSLESYEYSNESIIKKSIIVNY